MSEPSAEVSGQVPGTPALELRALVKRYGGVEAVKGIDLQVAAGEFMTVLGPSGSGKTTVLRLVAGFTDITDGKILLSGRDVSRMTPAERQIGMVFQNYALFPHMSAAANISYGLKMRRWAKDRRQQRVEEMLSLVGLEGMASRLPRELSGGQQQRVALARALAFGPTLLLMDEPLGALDRELRIRMAGELRRIHAELGTTFVYVTHDREEALTLSDRIAIMHNGEVEAIGTPPELFARPSSRFVASFFGGHNVVSTSIAAVAEESVTADVLGQQATVPTSAVLIAGESAALAIPASAIGAVPGDRHVSFGATVMDVLYMGETVHVTCQPDGMTSTLTAAIPANQHPDFGAGHTTLHIDLSRVVAVP